MKGVSKTVIAFGTDGFLGALIRIVFYRIASVSDYGVIGYLTTTAYFFAIFSLLGSDYSLIYYLASNDRKVSSGILSSMLFLPLIGFFADLIVTSSLESALLAYLAALSFAGTSSLVGSRRYNTLLALVITKRTIQAGAMILLYYKLGTLGAILGISLSMLPGASIFIAFLLLYGFGLDISLVKKIAKLNLTAVLITSSLYVDKVILGRIMSPEEFTGYYLAFQAILILNALADATMRSTTSESISGSIDMLSKILLIVLSLLAPIATRTLAPLAIYILGESAGRYIDLLRISGLYLPAAVILSYTIGRFVGSNRHKLALSIASIVIILRASLPPFGYFYYGPLGALIAYILATAIAGLSAWSYGRMKREKGRYKTKRYGDARDGDRSGEG